MAAWGPSSTVTNLVHVQSRAPPLSARRAFLPSRFRYIRVPVAQTVDYRKTRLLQEWVKWAYRFSLWLCSAVRVTDTSRDVCHSQCRPESSPCDQNSPPERRFTSFQGVRIHLRSCSRTAAGI
ncbi:hypothetical protein BaRGS_00014907, partial [Batillaria attramentaria]